MLIKRVSMVSHATNYVTSSTERSLWRGFSKRNLRVLKAKEIRQFGEYRTRRLVLEAWDRLETTLSKVQNL
jgi:hypothetical protein